MNSGHRVVMFSTLLLSNCADILEWTGLFGFKAPFCLGGAFQEFIRISWVI